MEFYKQCNKCKETKGINNFSENKKNADGLQAKCKSCLDLLVKKIEESGVKMCGRCLDLQPLSNFTKSKQTLDGYYGFCKDCKRIVAKTNALKYKKIKTSNITKKVKCSRWDNSLYK